MVHKHFTDLSPEETQVQKARIARLSDYWQCIWDCDDSGGTTWDVLEDFDRQVKECLDSYRERGRLSFIEEAEWLTAQAEYFRAGGKP